MIIPNHCQNLAPIYMQMTPVFSNNRRKVRKIDNVLNKELSLLCRWFINNMHFGENKTILFSKVRDLRQINISFAGHFIKQDKAIEYFGYQLYSTLSEEAMASKVLKKKNAKIKFPYRHSRYLLLRIEDYYVMR